MIHFPVVFPPVLFSASPTYRAMSWISLLSLPGEIPSHPNVIFLTSSQSQSMSSIPELITGQVSFININSFLNHTFKLVLPDDLIIISCDQNVPRCKYSCFEILGRIKTRSTTCIIVNWYWSISDLNEQVQNWTTAVFSYQLDSHLYFNLVNLDILIEIYSIHKSTFSNIVAHTYTSTLTLLRRRQNFKLSTITGSHVRKWNMETKTGGETSGWNVETFTPTYQYLAFMQDMLNFRLKTISASTFTELDMNGNWLGMSRQILLGESDLAISGAAVVSRTAQDFRFLSSTTSIQFTNVYYFSSETQTRRLFETTFQINVWIAIMLVIVTSSCVIIIISKEYNSFWWIVAWTTKNEWVTIENRIFSIKCLAFTVSLFSLVLTAIFSSHLISALAVQKPIVEGIDSLIGKGYSFGFDNISYIVTNQKNGERLSSANKMMQHLHPIYSILGRSGPTGGGSAVLLNTSKYAFVSEQDLYNALSTKTTSDRICDGFQSISLTEYGHRFSSFVRKDSPFALHFNYARLIMKEIGIAQRSTKMKEKFNKSYKPECKSQLIQPFDLDSFSWPFYILIGGTVLSLLIWLISMLSSCKMKKTETVLESN